MITALILLFLLPALVLLTVVARIRRVALRPSSPPSPSIVSVAPAIRVRVWRVYRNGRLIYETTSHESGAPLRRSAP